MAIVIADKLSDINSARVVVRSTRFPTVTYSVFPDNENVEEAIREAIELANKGEREMLELSKLVDSIKSEKK